MTTPAADDLSRIAAAARAAWPEIEVDDALFLERLSRAAAKGAVRSDELYLATACAIGVPKAIALFESKYMPPVDRTVRRVWRQDAADQLQEIRTLLLVGRREGRPLIEKYDGRGSLASWLRIVALRETLASSEKRAPPGTDGDDRLLEDLAASSDQELELLRSAYEPEFKLAFQAAFGSLQASERNLLRYAFVDGLDTAAIGRILKVHRTTASRQLEKVQEALLDRTKERLLDALDVGPMELESILRVVRSQLTLSLSRLLAGT